MEATVFLINIVGTFALITPMEITILGTIENQYTSGFVCNIDASFFQRQQNHVMIGYSIIPELSDDTYSIVF